MEFATPPGRRVAGREASHANAIETLVRGLYDTFGDRAPQICADQMRGAKVGSSALTVWADLAARIEALIDGS